MEEMWPLSGATVGQGLPLGFTWPCLVKMDGGGFPGGLFNFYKTGTIGTITAYATQTGTVQCNSPEPTWLTFLWVAILVFLHFALTILLVVWGALKLYGVKWPKPDKSSKDKKGSMAAPYWPALLVAALPVLSVASFGEIAQHVCHTGLEPPRTSRGQAGLLTRLSLALVRSSTTGSTWASCRATTSRSSTAVWSWVPACLLLAFGIRRRASHLSSFGLPASECLHPP